MRKKVPENIESILREVKQGLKEIYGKRLKKIILYGSYARGDADEGSDIDLIILLENMKDTCAEIDRISDRIGQMELEYDTLISIIPIDAQEFAERRFPFITNAKKEGIIV